MPRHLLVSIFSSIKHVVFIALLFISPACFALGEKLARQDEATLSLLAYSGITLLILFLCLTIYAFIRMKSKDKIIEIYDEMVANKNEILNKMNNGVILVGSRGSVVELTNPAAKLLGREKSRVLNQPLVGFFKEESKAAITKAMDGNEVVKIVVTALSSNMELRLTITKNNPPHDGVAFVVCIEDVNNYEKELKEVKINLVELNQLTEHLHLGQMSIDFESESFRANQVLSSILGYSGSVSGDFEKLHELICPNNITLWKQSFELAKEQHEVDFKSVLQSLEFAVPVRIVAISIAKNSKGKSTAFKLLVIDEIEIRQNQRKEYASEQKAKAMSNVSLHPVYILDDECRIISVNNPFEHMFGVRLADIKNKRFDLLNLVPEDINILHNPDDTPVTIGRTLNREFTGIVGKKNDVDHFSADTPQSFRNTNNGNTALHLRITLQAFGDDKNQRVGFAGMFQDLTLLTETQRQLESERAHFSNLLDIAPIAVVTVDADDRIVHANTAMTERLGINEKELKKGTFYQLFNDADAAAKAAKQLHQTGRLRDFHTSLRGKNEVMHPSELHIDLFDKEKEHYVCWISDRSGEQFQEDKFHGLLEHSSMPMAILDGKGFSSVNPAACVFFGVENEDDLRGAAPYSLDLNKDEGEADELERIVNKVKYDGRAKSLNWEHKNGLKLRPCHATYIPIYKGKEFDSILCMWTDLTEITQADEARVAAITAHKKAERKVAEKQLLLRSSHEQLTTKLKDLRDTKTKLQLAQDEISEAKIEYITLQEKHQSVTDNLQKVQQQYSQSREMLSEAQDLNNTLTEQLALSTKKVNNLQIQRNEISNQLQLSEKNFKEAQQQLEVSEENAKQLQFQQKQQQETMQAYVDQIDSLKKSITDKDAEINEVGSQITDLQEQLHSSDTNREKLNEALINQREAGEEAEKQRREIEKTYKLAQSELTNKVRHVEHLQNEMQKFEEMSKQEKGDMAAQQSKLMQELEEKQNVLQETQQALDKAKQTAEQEKLEKHTQQEELKRVESELAEAEQHASRKLQEMNEAEYLRLAEQQKLQEELKAKQQKLLETEQILSDSKQQTQAEKAEKLRQQALFDKLHDELKEFEQHSAAQQAKIEKSGKQWKQHQAQLKQEVAAKRQQLLHSQAKLDEIQQQADAEKLVRIEKEQKLEQLAIELSDVESRASKQREMLEGSEEQWTAHHKQIEEQKKQLQQALIDAQRQNQSLQDKLQGNLSELQQAESQVSETQSAEIQLQDELNNAKAQQEELEAHIKQQEQQELALKKQVQEQQATLLGREQSIQAMEEKQGQLLAQLEAVQQEYNQSKQSLTEQQNNQSGLAEQLATLENELQTSKAQLDDKEQALQQAQQQLHSNEEILAEQENALLAAHKEELHQAQEQMKSKPQESAKPALESAIAKMSMPENPSMWFDLLPYLQQRGQVGSLATELNELISELQTAITATDNAVMQDNNAEILRGARKLVQTAKKVNADALFDVVSRLEVDCGSGMIDNISISWPNTKRSFSNTLRVIYENLHG
jgi:epidermal growth factor receptor substrate 15